MCTPTLTVNKFCNYSSTTGLKGLVEGRGGDPCPGGGVLGLMGVESVFTPLWVACPLDTVVTDYEVTDH